MSSYSEAIRYEEIIQALYQALLMNEGYNNINVQRNVSLKGRSGATAQFDIFWEFSTAGVKHRVVIECKNYNRSVGVDDVREFAYKLHDVGNLKGIMVTRKGYQEGAIKTARDADIYLKKFQLPADMFWYGNTRGVSITLHTLTLDNLKRTFVPNRLWLAERLRKNEKLTVQFYAPTNQILLVDSEGNVQKTLWKLENELPRGEHSATALKHSFPMSGNIFLRTPNGQELMIDRIDYQYDVIETTQEISVSADAILHGLLSDIEGQDSFLFFLNNTIRRLDPDE